MTFSRTPLPGNCFPVPMQPTIDDPCASLPALRHQLYQLMAGGTTSQVRDGERWKTNHAGNVKELRAEIRKLETLCGPQGGRALRAGGNRFRGIF